MSNIMHLEDEATWPAQVIDYLDRYQTTFLNWELGNSDRPMPQYDQAIDGLRATLQTDHVLPGYHCTRLIDQEIQHILEHGMQLPNQELLYKRIDSLKQLKRITNKVAKHLKDKNLSDASNRKGMLWFCFYPPYIAGQSGIERFFRSWGGEALYVSHERDGFSGPILNRIGIPCIVEAHIPLGNLADRRIDSHIYRRYLRNRGFQIDRIDRYEDYIEQPVSSQNILGIIKFPSTAFIDLTKCDTWRPPLLV